MNDELNNMPDVQLSAVFVRDYLGREVDDGMMRMADTSMGGRGFESWRAIPPFATSADAVLPFLERRALRVEMGKAEGCQYGVWLWIGAVPIRVIQPTFARAACIVLIRAARAEKGGAS